MSYNKEISPWKCTNTALASSRGRRCFSFAHMFSILYRFCRVRSVMVFVIMIFGVSYHIAFYSQIESFRSIGGSIMTLFRLPFAEEFTAIDGGKDRFLKYGYFISYLMIATVLANLFM